MTVKLWDVQTGGVVKTFTGHTGLVWSVSISADFTKIASGSHDNTICLWDIQTRECHQTIEQAEPVDYVSFSPVDPQHLISISDHRVWQWDTNGHQIKPPYDGSCIAFSSDGIQFVSCNRSVVTVQNSDSGVIVAEFHMANDAYMCCFSPYGRLIAVAAGTTAYIWDITSSDPCLVSTFIGHTKKITSLAFSSPSSLISASEDQSVKFWRIGALSTDPVMANPQPAPPTSAQIESITLQAKDGITITIHSDSTVKTWDIFSGLCKSSFQIPVKNIEKRDVRLINGRLIFVCHADKTINIWDIEKGELLLAGDGLDGSIEDLRISGDGSRVFCLDAHFIQALSVQTGELVGRVEIVYSRRIGTLTVDGPKVWVHYPNSGYQGWDFGILGSLPVQLPNVPPYRLHPNGAVLWDPSLSGVKDNATGEVLFQLSGRHGKPADVQWSGQFLVVCYTTEDVLIFDFSNLFSSRGP